MPSFYSYGIHTFLEIQDTSSNSVPKLSRLSESTSKITWSPMQGMAHPILSTNVISPAKTDSPIPFCVVVEFDADIDHHRPNHAMGDVRIEVKIDGVVSGWRVLPQAKIWPKGARIEFSGLRVARTEETAFIFNPPPRGVEKSQDSLSVSTSKSSSIKATDTIETATIWSSEDPTLIPFSPSGLPLNTSHIEILITIGKKHNTLEKYLIFSPVLQEAFYIPPSSLSSNRRKHSININIQGTKRKLEPQQSNENEETGAGVPLGSPYRPAAIGGGRRLKAVGGQNMYIAGGTDKGTREWKPIGLSSVSQKTTQMREAEFTARIHLARFWFIIYPEPVNLDLPQAPISSILLPSVDGQHASKLAEVLVNKKMVQEKPLDDSTKYDITRVGDSDTLAGRKRRVINIKTSEINELLPARPRSPGDGKARKHGGVGSNAITKPHLGSESDDLRRRAFQKQTNVIPYTSLPG